MIPVTPIHEQPFATSALNNSEWHVWDAAKQIAAAYVASGFMTSKHDVSDEMKKIYKTKCNALIGESLIVARALIAELERSQEVDNG